MSARLGRRITVEIDCQNNQCIASHEGQFQVLLAACRVCHGSEVRQDTPTRSNKDHARGHESLVDHSSKQATRRAQDLLFRSPCQAYNGRWRRIRMILWSAVARAMLKSIGGQASPIGIRMPFGLSGSSGYRQVRFHVLPSRGGTNKQILIELCKLSMDLMYIA